MTANMLLTALLIVLALPLIALLRGRRYAHGWTARFIASPEFLRTPEWRRLRYDALRANDGRGGLCGRNKNEVPPRGDLPGAHVPTRRARPDLALERGNLAVLCSADNAGKGNRYSDDWRHPSHPHRK